MKLFSKFLMGAAVLGVMASGDASAAGKIVMDGSTTVGPIAKSFAAYFTKTTGTEVTVSESGSGNGAKSIINGMVPRASSMVPATSPTCHAP